jgi:hypothetical protein
VKDTKWSLLTIQKSSSTQIRYQLATQDLTKKHTYKTEIECKFK